MKTTYKILSIVILGIVVISSAFGASYLIPGLHTDDLLQGTRDGTWEYRISGEKGGAGPHTKSELIFTRTMVNEPRRTDSTELTKDLYYTDNILFWDWQIHTFENFVYVSWITSEQTWGDVFLAVSDDYGKTFDVKNISQSRNYVYQYKIDFSDETVYLTWQQDFKTEEKRSLQHIYFSKSNDFGDSFGEQILLSTFNGFAQEFDLEAFGDNVFVTWSEDGKPGDKYNVWFATSTDKAEWFDREAKLLASHVDMDSFNDVLHLTWVSVEDDTEIWYAYSKDLGQTLDSRIVFDADWKLSPYAERPIPKISAGEEIFIDFEMKNEEGEKTHYTIPVLDENKQEVDWSQITLMKPNSARHFYYPNPEQTENRDVFQMFSLIRLPEHLGGDADDISAFRAYSGVTLTTDHCVVKYWPDPGRHRLEDPCWGSMYRVIDGLMITNPDLIMNTSPVALPYLELSMDEYGTLYVEPPTFTREENGAIGTGRFISSQEIDHGSQIMIDGYEKSHPNHPKVPLRFAGNYLTELHAYGNDVEVRYADLKSLSSPYIDLWIDNVSAVDQQHFMNFKSPNSEFWQLGDAVFKISGHALDPNNAQSKYPQEYRIEFILNGFMFLVVGTDDELLKKAIVLNYFPEYAYDDMFLISTTVGK